MIWSSLYIFIDRTKTGRAMRAVGEDREIASLMGIDVDRIIVITFAIGGALAGMAGILFVLLFNQVTFDMGFIPGLKAFTAAVLGGIGSITGAALGGSDPGNRRGGRADSLPVSAPGSRRSVN